MTEFLDAIALDVAECVEEAEDDDDDVDDDVRTVVDESKSSLE